MLQKEIDEVKKALDDPAAPFGIDLAIPQIGGSARKTNHDYTHGASQPLSLSASQPLPLSLSASQPLSLSATQPGHLPRLLLFSADRVR